MSKFCAIYSAVAQTQATKQTILSLTSTAAAYQHVRRYSVYDIIHGTNTTTPVARFNSSRQIHALPRDFLSVKSFENCLSTVSGRLAFFVN